MGDQRVEAGILRAAWDTWQTQFMAAGLMRGVGWVILYCDNRTGGSELLDQTASQRQPARLSAAFGHGCIGTCVSSKAKRII